MDQEAAACARRAAEACGLAIVDLDTVAAQAEAADLLCRVWGAASPDALANAPLLRAMEHSGNFVVGGYRGGRLVGVALAFRGDGHLHSHITGVEGRGAGVGYALKQHQRAWSLARGIDSVRWTYDPLVRRNGYFNLHKLGAGATEYLPDFYGEMDDGINTGDTTDRLYIDWSLSSPRAVAAARGPVPAADRAALTDAGAHVTLDRDGDEPVVRRGAPSGVPLLVALPEDVEALRARDLAAALHWRHAVREALGGALAAGYAIHDATRDGYYVLRTEGTS